MNRSRRIAAVALSLTIALFLLPAVSPAAPMAPYSKQAFADARNAGKPIVVFVHAGWCVTCRKQEPTLKQLTTDPAFADVVVFVVEHPDAHRRGQGSGDRARGANASLAGRPHDAILSGPTRSGAHKD